MKNSAMLRLLTFSVIYLINLSQVFAWAETGHRLTASVAFRQLSPENQKAIITILKNHPRYKEDFEQKMPREVSESNDEKTINEWLLQTAAVWPDYIKGLPEEIKSVYNKGPWHYINYPLYLSQRDEEELKNKPFAHPNFTPPNSAEDTMNVIQLIRFASERLKNPNADPKERALMLTWLLHTVGDIHQPMHGCSIFSVKLFPTGDRGGNDVLTEQKKNLHAVWDQFPGDRTTFRNARNDAIKLVNDKEKITIGKTAIKELDPEKWLKESYELAIRYAYSPEVRSHVRTMEEQMGKTDVPPLNLQDDYLKTGGKVCETRIVEGGYRLGEILKQICEGKK